MSKTLTKQLLRLFEFRHIISFLMFFSISCLAITNLAYAQIKTGSYTLISGQPFLKLENGDTLQGTYHVGGIQPDYKLDFDSPEVLDFINQARIAAHSKMNFWQKIASIQELVIESAFKYRNYSNPFYRGLLKGYRKDRERVPFSQFLKIKSGVCREYAIALHIALRAAGIENEFAYAKITRDVEMDSGIYKITEDHAFNVVKYRGQLWMVDSYYGGFNGFLLHDALSLNGLSEHSSKAPIANTSHIARRIVSINSYPYIYRPESISSNTSCKSL